MTHPKNSAGTSHLPPLDPPSQSHPESAPSDLPSLLARPITSGSPTTHPWGQRPWPSDGKEKISPSVHRDRLRELARRLQRDLNRYERLAGHLRRAGNLNAADIGQWQAAQDLHTTHQEAHGALRQLFDAHVNAYASLIARINQTAQAYDDAEWETTTAIRKIEGDMHHPEADPAAVTSDGAPKPLNY
ncbi:hypothetical protein GCM10023196_083780 [Actinoallomurus vinaceus]|uniref:Uncharacterized protein n=1 Tax=Actinoallomurus vinaceus TaxID=1080074 RepID=A0ABP8UQ92_9ACTN